MRTHLLPLFGFALLPLGGAAAETQPAGAAAITPAEILRHVRVLASDEFEGRGPGTVGEDKTVAYLIAELTRLGLQPGNPDGTFVQNVPVTGFTATPAMSYATGDQRMELTPVTDFVASSHRLQAEVAVKDSEIVFVGYGIVAPEYGWDDYQDADVRGKTILMLIGDPPIPDPANPAKLDASMFRGKAMTYYGRWTYKYEIAALKGAAAAIIVHETGPASYPWGVVTGSWGGESCSLLSAQRNADLVSVESWITLDRAVELAKAAGRDFNALKQAALRRDFRPIPLGARADITIKNRLRDMTTHNVVARIDGTDPQLKNELVIYSAHWDHLGRDPRRAGDQIFHGARDNASAVGGLLAIARAYRTLPEAPKRSVLFLFPTLEEKGLLGARYYASHPLYPLARTVAVINKDGLNPYGPTRDVSLTGDDNSTLVDLLRTHAAAQGRRVAADPKPEHGSYYRSDHFEFAQAGVPALDTGSGIDFIGRPAGWGLQRLDEYIANDYHKPSDNLKPDFTFEGGALDAQLLFAIGLDVANAATRPAWKPGSEFKARRDAMLNP
jgi:Zn-dependent M28 family amino/carboxypeptidase